MARTRRAGPRSAAAFALARLSLRARLLLGLVLIAAAGLVVADVVVYNEIRSYLVGQVNASLVTALQPELRSLERAGDGGFPPFQTGNATPPGTYGAVLVGAGEVAIATPSSSLLGPPPALPRDLFDEVAFSSPQSSSTLHYLSTGAVGNASFAYQVLAVPATVDGSLAAAIIVAVPLASLNGTLAHLVEVDLVVSAVVLAVLAGAGYLVVRIGLRPLAEIEETAGAIAGGDLSRRVERSDERTEVGRLGIALNSMLAQIERAFSHQRASESRLRQFLADASHELRTPVTSIRGYAELFRRGAANRPEDLALAMRRIEDEAIRMGVLVDDLLLLARLDQGRPLEQNLVDLSQVATDAAADAQLRAPDRPVTVDAAHPVLVLGDEARLHQVVANLLENALRHTPAGTPVAVGVETRGERAVLYVADEGPGIAPEHAGRVFERFYRADPSRTRNSGGSGLGLSIVASIAEAHGGTVRLETEVGRGSRFVVELPLAGAANGPSPAGSDDDVAPPAEDPATEDPAAEDPAAEDSAAEDPATEDRGPGDATPLASPTAALPPA